MSNDIKIGINISDGGTGAKVNKVAQDIKASLEGAVTAAARIPQALNAARQGVTASNEMRTPAKSTRAPAGINSDELKEYGTSRGVTGATGAASRDFAKQAQGLGGLVHVYATFAANLFAVSAAFSALSKAADTTNMVKGLDQLGASSGRALGSLAKQLSSVTDGAISMRDAMTATVSASAGGMTNAAILRMGVVAKQASQALGVAMPDALSRISRGITKLEPELLDEIGIMVRVDTASQEYARTLGKTASALTDFEKRQGFANAVLEQGEKKFGAIKLDTNPYDKILASMQNIAQTGLELVNKVLGPLVNLLSSSPAALATVMVGIGTILLKQAIPAIGMFRENARRMSEETTTRVKRQVEEQREAAVQLDVIAAKRAETEYLTTGAGLKKLQALRDASFNSKILGSEVRVALRKSPLDLTPEESGKILSKHKELQDKISSGTASKGESDQYTKLEARAVKVKEITASISKVGDAAAEANEKKDSLWWTHQRQKEAYLKKLEAEAKKSGVVSNAAENAAVMGPGIAFKTLKADLASLEGGRVSKIGTAIKGTFAIATSAVSTFMNSISGVLMIVGLVTAAFGILSSWLSTNSKESDKFANSITGASDAVDNLKRTLDFIADKDPLAVFSVETIQARANALQGLSDSLVSLVKDFNAVQKASSWFDKGIDALFDSIGRGSADKLSTNLAESISAGLSGAATIAAKSEAVKKLQDILGKNIDVTNIEAVNSELRKLSNPEIAVAGAAINKVIRDISLSANNAASTLAAATARITELSTLVQTQNLALTPTDAVGKLGTAMVSSASEISKSLEDPINSLLVLNKLTKDSRTLSLLSPTTSSELIAANQEIQNLSDTYGRLQQDLIKGEKALQDLKSKGIGKNGAQEVTNRGVLVDTQAAVDAKNYIAKIQASIVEAEGKMKAVSSDLSNKVATDFVNIGLSKLNLSLKAAMSEGGISAARGYLSVLKEAGVGTAEAETKLAQQELGMQKQVIEATYSQIREQQKNTNALELSSISTRLLVNQLALENAGTSEINREKALKEQAGLEKELTKLVEKVRITEMKPKDALALRAGGDFSAEVLVGMAPYMTQLTGYLSAIATTNGKMAAVAIQGFASKEKESLTAAQKGNTTRISDVGTELGNVNSAISLSAEYDKDLQTKKDILEIEKRSLELTNERLKIDSDLRIIAKASESGSVSKAKIDQAITEANASWQSKEAKFASETNLAKLESLKTEQKGLEDIRQKNQANAELVRSETQAIASIKLTQQADELKYLESLGAVTAAEAAGKQTLISLDQQAIEFEKQRVDLVSKYVTSFIALENSKKLAGPGAEADKFTAQQILLEASYQRQITAQDLLNTGKVTAITLAGQQEVLAKTQADQMDKMVSVTESLSTIFGELGSNIGLAGQALLKMAQDDEKYLKNKTDLEDKLAKARKDENPEEELKLKKNIGELDKKQAVNEISNIGKVAGASKKVFSEKTTAYKILDGIEKASAAYKMAVQVKEVALDLKNFAIRMGLMQTEVAAEVAKESAQFAARAASASADLSLTVSTEAAKNAAKTPGVFMSFLNWLGPWGMAAAGVAIAAVLGGGGGGAKVNTAGLTAEDMQKSQGTGQSWKGGKLVNTGGGVFGDSEAKSNSIFNSLELIKDNSIEGLEYDNKSLSILESIDKGIEKTAIALYQTQGIATGSGFGTTESKTSSPGFLGMFASSDSTEILNSGIQFAGTFADMLNKDGKGFIAQFEDVLKTSSSSGIFGLFSSSSEELVNNVKDLDTKVASGLREVFSNMGDLFVSQGAELGIDAKNINGALASIPVELKASLKGLKGKELREELGYIMSGIQDDLATKLFPTLTKFRQFGEGMSQTVTRVLDSNKKFGLSLNTLGIDLKKIEEVPLVVSQALLDGVTSAKTKVAKLTKDIASNLLTEVVGNDGTGEGGNAIYGQVQDLKLISALTLANTELTEANNAVLTATNSLTTYNLDLSEALIENAGGLEQFLENIKFFGDNFLTEAQRLEPIAASVNASMTKAGTSSTYAAELFKKMSDGGNGIINTREEFSKLYVENLRVATSSGVNAAAAQTLVTALDKVGPAYLTTVEALEKTRTLQEELMTAEGKGVEVIALQRGRELLAMSEGDAALQARIWKLEDEKDAVAELAGFDAAGLGKMMLDAAFNPQEGYTSAQSFGAALNKSIRNTLISNTINTVAESLFTGIITPILMGQMVSETTTDALIASATTKADQLASVLGSPAFANAIASIATTVGTVIDKLGMAAQSAANLNIQAPNVTQNNVAATAGREPILGPNEFISPTTGNIVTWTGQTGVVVGGTAAPVHTDTGRKPTYAPLNGPTLNTFQPGTYGASGTIGGYSGYDQTTNATTSADTAAKKAEELKKAQVALDVELLNLQGKTFAATAMAREEELRVLKETNPTLESRKKLIYAEQDSLKTASLNLELLTAQGKSQEVLTITRDKELLALSESDKVIKKLTYAAQDLNKTNELQYTLMNLLGKSYEVTKLRREKELRTLSTGDKALQTRIWLLEDEKAETTAINSQQVTLLELLGRSSEALAITRATELENLEESLRPRQKYIYALQDEQAIREKLKTSLKSNSDSLKGFINTLKETRSAMLLGSLTTLTPEQRYQEAKSQKDAIAKAAVAIAVTDSEIATRNDAISKLPSVTNTFLEASKELYASSAQYTQDFNSVLDLLDLTSNNLIDQATVADNQLSKLESISDSSDSIESLTEKLLAAQTATATALATYLGSGTGAGDAGQTAISTGQSIENLYKNVLGRASDAEGKAYWVDRLKTGTSLGEIENFFKNTNEGKVQVLYNKLAGRVGEQAGVKYWSEALNSGMPKPELVRAFASAVVSAQGESATDLAKRLATETDPAKLVVPGFAKGGIASGIAVVGERGPELVDFATPSRVYSNKASNDLLNNRELIAEIRNLRKEVAELRADQREQTGHLIASNYDANSANAKEIAKATEEAAQAQVWNARSKVKLA